MQEIDTSPQRLRATANFVEETILDAVEESFDIPLALTTGGLKNFPRPSPEDQAAEQGLAVLDRSVRDVVAALHALAAAKDAGQEPPPLLLEQVRPYLEAYARQEEEQREESDQTQA